MVFPSSAVISQENFTCGFDALMHGSPSITTFKQRMLQVMSTSHEREYLDWRQEEITIPVVFHIVWNKKSENISEEIILQQVRVLNRDFNMLNPGVEKVPDEFKPFIGNPRIRFCLAAEDPYGNPTNGIVRVPTDVIHIATPNIDSLFFSSKGGSDAWDTDRYLNIWIAETGTLVAAYAIPPWYPDRNMWGVILTPQTFSGRMKEGTIVHEVAHYLGLLHLWGYDMYGRPTCEYDDGIADTPTQYVPDIVCSNHPKITCGTADMTMNYMNYNKDECQYMFTEGQAQWMRTFIQLYNPSLAHTSVPCVSIDRHTPLKQPFVVWPNPIKAGGIAHVNFDNFVAETGHVELYSLLGHTVFDKQYILRNNMEIMIPELPAGVYIMRVGESLTKIVVH